MSKWLKKTHAILDEGKAILTERNKTYGDSIFKPLNIVTTATAPEQVLVMINQKLERIRQGGGTRDTWLDLMNYTAIYLALTRRQ